MGREFPRNGQSGLCSEGVSGAGILEDMWQGGGGTGIAGRCGYVAGLVGFSMPVTMGIRGRDRVRAWIIEECGYVVRAEDGLVGNV